MNAENIAALAASAAKADEPIPDAGIGIDWADFEEALLRALEGMYEESAKETEKEIGGAAFNELNEAAREYAAKRSAELVTQIDETTRQRIRDAVAAGLDEGLVPSVLAERLTEIVDDEARASLIARTELAAAQMEAAREAAIESGLVDGKRSLLSNDHDEKDICDEAADEGVIPIGEPFASGRLMPPHHLACWCDVAMEVIQ